MKSAEEKVNNGQRKKRRKKSIHGYFHQPLPFPARKAAGEQSPEIHQPQAHRYQKLWVAVRKIFHIRRKPHDADEDSDREKRQPEPDRYQTHLLQVRQTWQPLKDRAERI